MYTFGYSLTHNLNYKPTMKKLYTLGVTLSMVLFGTYSFAQIKTLDQEPVQTFIKNDVQVQTKKKFAPPKDDDPDVYFYEDFSNGVAGMGDNGAWTKGEAEGELWIHVYPEGSPEGGYDPAQPIGDGTHPLYGTKVSFPNTSPTLSSPTADNGMMMIDMSRYNGGLGQVEGPTATASLTSPTIDLSAAPSSDILLKFYQRLRLCCDNSSAVVVRVSVDGGTTWIPFNVFNIFGAVNEIIEVEASLDLTEILEQAADLSQVKVQFYWEGPQRFYYWYVDDVQLVKVPDNDLVAKRTFYNDYIDYRKQYASANTVSNDLAVNYIKGFEYIQDPIYITRPLNFAMEVENVGLVTQTDVRLKVIGTSTTSEATHEWISETGISIAPGEMDTIRVSNVLLSDIEEVAEGQYTFTYEAVQAEVDKNPEDNLGRTRSYNISSNILRNDEGTISTSRYDLASDVIWANRYSFPQESVEDGNIYLTHIETMFLQAEDWAETQAGEVIYFNVRLGDVDAAESHIYFGDPAEGWSYENPELEFEILPEHLFEYGEEDPVWVPFELPSPILVQPNTVYQAEYRVPFSIQDIVYPMISSGINTEPYSAIVGIPPSGNDPGVWSALGNSTTDRWNGIIMRFRTNKEVGIETATTENGITLVQNWPNPFTDKTTIQFNVRETTKAKLEVRDITGKLVHSQDFGTIPAYAVKTVELNRGNLAPGVYTYSVVTPESRVTRKLTIQ